MQAVTDARVTELKTALATAITYLQTVRETEWASRLETIRAQIDSDRAQGIRALLAAFEGNESFNRLYLSGPRNGHSLSERQEIEANGKLHVIRQHIYALVQDIMRSES